MSYKPFEDYLKTLVREVCDVYRSGPYNRPFYDVDFDKKVTEAAEKGIEIPSNEYLKRYQDVVLKALQDTLTEEDVSIEAGIDTIIENKDAQFTKQSHVTPTQFVAAFGYKKTKVEYAAFQHKYFGSKKIAEWYNIYLQKLKQKQVANKKQQRYAARESQKLQIKDDALISYPFSSKIRKYRVLHPGVKTEPLLQIEKIKKKYLLRPYYSNQPGGWEIDHVFNLLTHGDSWLFCININTRYLIVEPCAETSAAVISTLNKIINDGFDIKSIRGDGSVAYSNKELMMFYKSHNINTYFNKGKFTNHNRIVDSVVRTIRNAVGYRKINAQQLQQIVNYYNSTYHSGIAKILKRLTDLQMTPFEMQADPELEWYYIRRCNEKAETVLKIQKIFGFLDYKPGNILLARVDLSKTADKNEKRRGEFDRLGIFIKYVNGNVELKLNRPILIGYDAKKQPRYDDIVVLPIYYTRKVAEDIYSIPAAVANTYSISNL